MELKQAYLTKNPYYNRNVYKADGRYATFQARGPLGLMLHSVGCAQPSAMVFINSWNSPTYETACIHGFIDANTGVVYQTMPWNYRAPHCAGSGNNTHVGVEMCESKYIRYLKDGEPGYAPGKFVVLDYNKARADCSRAYQAAVELFAMLCKKYNLSPIRDICSHKEGHAKGIASNHGDPEHYWRGLGMSYTMDGFRLDVRAVMSSEIQSGGSTITSPENPGTAIAAGMLVRVSKDAVYYTGKEMPDLVKNTNWFVKSVSGDRAVIDKSQDGRYSIASPVNVKYLTDVSPYAGSLVSVAPNATYYNGKEMPQWVKSMRWYVKSVVGDRAVIDRSEDGTASIASAVEKKYLTAVR